MSARSQWRYIAWTRAVHSQEPVRAFFLNLSRKFDCEEGPPPLMCRIFDRLAGWPLKGSKS